MRVSKYLKENQKTVYQTFLNALSHARLSHAYLLMGEQGTPLLECATYLAKSLLCDHPSPLACEECLTCTRVDEGNYADIIIIDGRQKTIKKDDVHEIESRFDTSAIESKGVMIYIINLVENMTAEAVNSLLKFLEEPSKNIYAFLTTENSSKVLPTIISRTQTLHFKNVDKNIIKEGALLLGVEPDDGELLCNFFNNEQLIKDKSVEPDYLNAKVCLNTTIDVLKQNKRRALVILHQEVLNKIKTKEAARLYLDMLSIVFKDIVNLQIGSDLVLNSYRDDLLFLKDHLKNVDKSLLEILNARGMIDLNVNISLLIDHLINYIRKGD